MTPEAVLLEVDRTFECSQEKLFDAWTKPEIMKKWWGKSERYVCDFIEIDLRPGGAYRFGMRFVEKTEPYVSHGKYLEISRPEKIVFSWSWEHQPEIDSVVTVEFKKLGEQLTRLVLTHEKLPDQKSCDSHKEGWTGVMDRLEAVMKEVKTN